ncbi:MAG: DegV family protein [Clostridia bacterium]|nr:DegV family protein [Clostridia bacterium]
MVKIMIDSAADIGKEEAQQLGAIMVPMIITIGEEDFYDGIDLNPTSFYEKLIESAVLPKTSLVNAFRWEEAYKENLGEDDELIVITISSKLSGTYNSAVEASEKFNNRVHVIDSLNAAVGERLLCQYALNLVQQGLSAKEIVTLLNEKKSKIKLIALVGTLEYLKKGGRISSAVAFAGELVALKPVIGVVDGEVKLLGKAMGSKKGNNLLNKLIQESSGIDFTMPHGTIWSGLSTVMLDKYIQDSSALWEGRTDSMPRYPIGATIGTHVGPGAVGFAFFEK